MVETHPQRMFPSTVDPCCSDDVVPPDGARDTTWKIRVSGICTWLLQSQAAFGARRDRMLHADAAVKNPQCSGRDPERCSRALLFGFCGELYGTDVWMSDVSF